MDSNNRNSKKSSAENLPPELSWDRMKDGIAQRMQEMEAETAARQSGNKRQIVVRVLLLVLLLLPLTCYLTVREPEVGIPVQTNGLKVSPPPANGGGSRSIAVPQTLEDALEKTQVETSGEEKPDDSNQNVRLSGEVVTANPEVIAPQVKANAEANSPIDEESAARDERPENRLPNTSVAPVFTLPVAPFFPVFSDSDSSTTASIATVSTAADVPADRAVSQSLSLAAGATFWEYGYTGELAERVPYEQSLLSHNVELQYARTFKRGFVVSASLQYVQLESRFDWSTPAPDQLITLRDTVTQIRVNTITGDREEVRGDVDVWAPAERVVRHFNRSRLVQLSLAAGQTWQWGRWRAEAQAGLGVSLLTGHRGRTLYEGELFNYEGNSVEVFSDRLQFQVLAGGRITYMLTNRFGLTSALQWQQNLTNWNPATETGKMRPRLVHVRAGIFYQW